MFLLSGCSLFKRTGRTDTGMGDLGASGSIIQQVMNNNISTEDFFIQKAEVTVSQPEIDVKFNAAIKFKKPDSLLISVKTKLGIEAGRAFISADTIIIIDRINRNIMVGDARSIKRKYGIEPGYVYALWGDLIIGKNVPVKPVKCNKGTSTTELEIDDRKIIYKIDCNRKKATRTYFEGDIRSSNIELNYSDFVRIDGKQVPRKIDINDDLNNVDITIEIKKITIPWRGSLNFAPNNAYKVIRIR